MMWNYWGRTQRESTRTILSANQIPVNGWCCETGTTLEAGPLTAWRTSARNGQFAKVSSWMFKGEGGDNVRHVTYGHFVNTSI